MNRALCLLIIALLMKASLLINLASGVTGSGTNSPQGEEARLSVSFLSAAQGILDNVTDEPFEPAWIHLHTPARVIIGPFVECAGSHIYLGATIELTSGISAIYLVKYDLNGNMIWNLTHTLNKTLSHYLSGGFVHLNGAIYLTGIGGYNTSSSGLLVSKISESGNLQWSFVGDNWLSLANPSDIVALDNSIYVAGTVHHTQTHGNAFLMRIEENQTIAWSVEWDPVSFKDLAVISMTTLNGHIYLTGKGEGTNGESMGFLLKYDENGNLLWERTGDRAILGGDSITSDGAGSVYMVARDGITNNRLFLSKYSENGTPLWKKEIGVRDNLKIDNGKLVYHNSLLYHFAQCTTLGSNRTSMLCFFKFDMSGYPLWMKTYTKGLELAGDGSVLNDWEYFAGAIIFNGQESTVALMKGLIPTMPANFSVEGLYRKIDLAWRMPNDTNNHTISSYRLYRNTTAGNLSFYREFSATQHRFSDLNLSFGVKFCYKITAVVSGHEGEATPPACAISYAEPGPPYLQASASEGDINLTWEAPGSDNGSPITSYTIYRGTSSGGESFLIKLGNVLNYTDKGVTHGLTYYYQVSATNSIGEGPRSNEVSATPSGAANKPPVANFSFSPLSPTIHQRIQFTDLSWDPDGTIEFWLWDFGDETQSTEKNPVHQFKIGGDYAVTLTVTDNKKATTSCVKTISVKGISEDQFNVVSISILILLVVIATLMILLLLRNKKRIRIVGVHTNHEN